MRVKRVFFYSLIMTTQEYGSQIVVSFIGYILWGVLAQNDEFENTKKFRNENKHAYIIIRDLIHPI